MIGALLFKAATVLTNDVVDQELALDASGMAVVTGLRNPTQLGSGACPLDGVRHLRSLRDGCC
jgi:hypothetical protein